MPEYLDNMNKEKLLIDRVRERLTVNQNKILRSIELEDGLADDCKIMIYLNVEHREYGTSYPVKTLKEARTFIKKFYKDLVNESLVNNISIEKYIDILKEEKTDE